LDEKYAVIICCYVRTVQNIITYDSVQSIN